MHFHTHDVHNAEIQSIRVVYLQLNMRCVTVNEALIIR